MCFPDSVPRAGPLLLAPARDRAKPAATCTCHTKAEAMQGVPAELRFLVDGPALTRVSPAGSPAALRLLEALRPLTGRPQQFVARLFVAALRCAMGPVDAAALEDTLASSAWLADRARQVRVVRWALAPSVSVAGRVLAALQQAPTCTPPPGLPLPPQTHARLARALFDAACRAPRDGVLVVDVAAGVLTLGEELVDVVVRRYCEAASGDARNVAGRMLEACVGAGLCAPLLRALTLGMADSADRRGAQPLEGEATPREAAGALRLLRVLVSALARVPATSCEERLALLEPAASALAAVMRVLHTEDGLLGKCVVAFARAHDVFALFFVRVVLRQWRTTQPAAVSVQRLALLGELLEVLRTPLLLLQCRGLAERVVQTAAAAARSPHHRVATAALQLARRPALLGLRVGRASLVAAAECAEAQFAWKPPVQAAARQTLSVLSSSSGRQKGVRGRARQRCSNRRCSAGGAQACVASSAKGGAPGSPRQEVGRLLCRAGSSSGLGEELQRAAA